MCPVHNGFSINVNLPFRPFQPTVVILKGVMILNQYLSLQSKAFYMHYVFKQPLEVNSPTICSCLMADCSISYRWLFEPLLEYL